MVRRLDSIGSTKLFISAIMADIIKTGGKLQNIAHIDSHLTSIRCRGGTSASGVSNEYVQVPQDQSGQKCSQVMKLRVEVARASGLQ